MSTFKEKYRKLEKWVKAAKDGVIQGLEAKRLGWAFNSKEQKSKYFRGYQPNSKEKLLAEARSCHLKALSRWLEDTCVGRKRPLESL